MTVRWMTLFLDRPADSVGAATDFWERVTGTTRSTYRGEHQQFTTLVPHDGDAHLRVQRIDDGPAGTHLDLHTDDVDGLVSRAADLGATLVRDTPVATVRSPGGYRCCVVRWRGEATPPAPHAGPSGSPSRVDQLCLDIAPHHLDAEIAFWSALLDWPAVTSTLRPEFTSLTRPERMPMRLLLQRLDASDGPTTGHIDLAAGERVEEVVADHLAAGAEVEIHEWIWTVLRDPSGQRYCVTRRDPIAGVVTHLPPPR